MDMALRPAAFVGERKYGVEHAFWSADIDMAAGVWNTDDAFQRKPARGIAAVETKIRAPVRYVFHFAPQRHQLRQARGVVKLERLPGDA